MASSAVWCFFAEGDAGAEAVTAGTFDDAGGDWPPYDLPAYWQFHLSQELRRVHQARYADNVIPAAA